MSSKLRILAALAACGLLAGCLSPAKIERALEAADRVSDFSALDRRVNGMPQTSAANLPTTGRAQFQGMGNLTIDPSNGTSTLRILGDVNMTADFGADTVTGNMINMRGVSGTNLTNSKYFDAVGTVRFGQRSSSIDRSSETGGFETDFRGTFDTDVRGQWTIDGTLEGAFVGTDGPTGIIARSRDANAIRKTSDNQMSLEVTAER